MELHNKSEKDGDVMAVTNVTATLANNTENLSNQENNIYSGEMTAPKENGDYTVSILAYDDAGNVAEMQSDVVEVSLWHTPKTNWLPTDRFNFVDYNRIKNNLIWLHEKVQNLWKPFEIEDMGDDIDSYESYWPVAFFNAWEHNLDIINKNVLIRDYGEMQTFYENGVFIQWDELNRIEGATLEMRGILDSQEAGLRRLSFRLGTFKEVKV